MEIAAILPNSILDFPGKMALTVFCQGCNRYCNHCHNKELIPEGPGKIGWDYVLCMLKERGRWLDAVVFSGGEPCLQEDLADKMVEVLEQGFAVGLHTNGDFLTGKITELCDYILLSQHNREKIQIAKKAKHLSLSTVKWNKSLEKYENKIVVVK